MFAKTIYKAVESAIKQGGLKLKNESKPSWEKYVLDFLFYIRTPRERKKHCCTLESIIDLYISQNYTKFDLNLCHILF